MTSSAATTYHLSGTWTGTYDGTYKGTLTLTWTQTGSAVKGTIKLTSPAETLDVTGLLKAATITFGSVGPNAIIYSGNIAGNKMTGQYHVGANGGGSWSATRG